MIAVIYDPADGRIVQTVQGAPATIAADPRPHIVVTAWAADYDVTHRVVGGAVVAIEGAA